MRLLDEVCYLSREASEVVNLFGEKITVQDTFPYNPDSKTAPDTAERWAHNGAWDYTNNTRKTTTPTLLQRPNEPFSITITDLDVRSQGGRAYKAIDSSMRRFDLREDQVLEIFKHVGVSPGGHVPGQFVWGVLGSQMRMVLVGGALHIEMVEQLKDLKDFKQRQALGQTPTEGSLQFGHVYRKRDQTLHLYLGKVKLPETKKASFAFLELPARPNRHDELDFDNCNPGYSQYIPCWRKEREIADTWDTMSVADRCEWDWKLQYEGERFIGGGARDDYEYCEDIVLMASPKFEAEDSQVDVEFATTVRENANARLKYANSQSDDLAEDAFKAKNGGINRNWYLERQSGAWYRLERSEQEKLELAYRAKVHREALVSRAQFQSELVWL